MMANDDDTHANYYYYEYYVVGEDLCTCVDTTMLGSSRVPSRAGSEFYYDDSAS